MPKISVISCSIRPTGIALVDKALRQQTFQDFEHIVQGREGKIEGNAWTLNQDYNIALRKAKGELIISWQDYTYARPDTLERFWEHYQQESNTIVGAVGNKYTDDSWTVISWQDPRMRDDQGSYYEVYFQDIEANLCSFPKQALYDIGGFMEDLDERYGLDAFNVLERLKETGKYKFKLDQSIKSYSLEHGRLPDWDVKNWIQNNSLALYEAKVRKLRKQGKYPIAPYLQSS